MTKPRTLYIWFCVSMFCFSFFNVRLCVVLELNALSGIYIGSFYYIYPCWFFTKYKTYLERYNDKQK